MTNEEHIEGLKGIKPFLQSVFLKENYEGCGELDAREVGETIDAAISALEKQIPKKQKPDNYEGHRGRKCPECGRQVWRHQNFCENCGQAIDWSDEE